MGERIKDLIYDFSDIIISLVIITMIFGVVSWKISDSMAYTQFTGQPTNAVLDKNDKDSENKAAETQANGSANENSTDSQGNSTTADTIGANTTGNTTTTTPPPATNGSTTTDNTAQGGKPTASAGTTTPATSTAVNSDIKIVIPAGSAGITIAKILKEQGVITDTKAFISRVDALKMGPKLKAGTFTIKAGSSLDDVIYTIAGKK